MARTQQSPHPSDHRSIIAVRPAASTVLGTVTVLLLATSIAPPLARSADGPSIAVQQWGGAVTGVAADGDTAYVAIGPRLAVVDVADAAAPRIVGQSEPVDDVVTHMFVRGERAYALGATRGLLAFDVANPEAPRLVYTIPALGLSTDLDVVGERAFICDDKGGVRIVDLDASSGPALVGSWTPQLGKASTAAAQGSRVFVGIDSDPPALVVLDVSVLPPIEVGRLPIDASAPPRDITVSPGRAYIALGGEIGVIDIADPSAPQRIEHDAPHELNTLDVLKADADLLWAASTSLAYVLDARDPNALDVRSVFDLDNNLLPSLAVDGGRAYIGDSTGLHIVEVGAPLIEPIDAVGAPDAGPDGAGAPDRPLGLAQHDGVVFVAGGPAGLRVFDGRGAYTATEVARFAPASSAQPGEGTTAVTVAGDRAFVTEVGRNGWLRVFDISDPLRPLEMGGIAGTGIGGRPGIAGDLVAIPVSGALDGGVKIFRVTDDGKVRSVGSLAVRKNCSTATFDGATLYLGSDDGLFVVDVADPSTPVLRGWLPEVSVQDAIVVIGPQRIAIAETNFGLYEVDVTDPAAPKIVARHLLTGGATAIARHGDELWVASDYAGLTRMAIVAGAALTVTGRWHVQRAAFLVAPGADRVWLATADGLVAVARRAPSMPWNAGILPSPGFLLRAAIEGDRLAAVSGFDMYRRSIHVLDDVDPIQPLGAVPLGPLGSNELPGDALDLVNGVAWVPAGGYGAIGFDTQDPAAIRRLTAVRMDDDHVLEHLAVVGQHAVGVIVGPALVSIDLSDPVEPSWLSQKRLSGDEVTAVDFDGATAWLLAPREDGAEVAAYDISEPSSIIELGRWPLSEEAYDLAVEGDRLVIAGGVDGLLIWDVADPPAAAQVGAATFKGVVKSVALSNGIAWTAEWGTTRYRVHAVDLLAADGPKVLASVPIADRYVADIAADGWTAAVANGLAGMYALHLVDPPVRPTPAPLPTAVRRDERRYFPIAFDNSPVAPAAHFVLTLDRSAAMALAAGDLAPSRGGPSSPPESRLEVAQRVAVRLATLFGIADVRMSLIVYDQQAERVPATGAAAVSAALATLAIDAPSPLAASARHDVALAAVAAELAGAPERCLATVVITAGRSAGAAADGMALARARGLGARGIARHVVRVGSDPAADGAWLAELAGDAGRLWSVRSPTDAEAAADRLAAALTVCP